MIRVGIREIENKHPRTSLAVSGSRLGAPVWVCLLAGEPRSHTHYMKHRQRGKNLTEKTHKVQKHLAGLVKNKRHKTNKTLLGIKKKHTEITTNAAEIKQTVTGNFKQDHTNPLAMDKHLMAPKGAKDRAENGHVGLVKSFRDFTAKSSRPECT